MNLYQKIRKKHQDEINDFPIYFAFGNEQFDEIIKKLGLSEDENSDNYFGKRLVTVGSGGFLLREDAPKLTELLENHSRQLSDLIAADKTGEGFIRDMFYYELCNHEYGYVYDEAIEETLAVFGYTYKDIESDQRLSKGLQMACDAIKDSF